MLRSATFKTGFLVQPNATKKCCVGGHLGVFNFCSCSCCSRRTPRMRCVFANATFIHWWARDREVAREPESGCRALLPCPMAHARRHARAVSCARATTARTAKSSPALVTGPLGRSGPQVLCRGVGNDLLRSLSLSRRCPLHWADGPAFTGSWLYLKRELRTSRKTDDHGRRAPLTDV